LGLSFRSTHEPNGGHINGDMDRDRRLELAAELAVLPPRVSLLNPDIACMFSHYIDNLAPWYDLNDASHVFGTDVPVYAMNVPVLFRAIIALGSVGR
jgi:hypothetical protein